MSLDSAMIEDYRVKDDHGHWLALVFAKEDHQVPKMPNYLTWDEARRVAKAIARLPRAPSETGLVWKLDPGHQDVALTEHQIIHAGDGFGQALPPRCRSCIAGMTGSRTRK